MNTDTGLRELTEQECRAVELFHQDEPMELIKVETGLTRSQIAAAVSQARVLAERPTPPPAKPAPAAPTAVSPAARVTLRPPLPQVRLREPAAPAPAADVASWTVEALLDWADRDGATRARSLAARIRLAANDLRQLAGRGSAVREAEAKVDKLAAQLAAAREALRIARGAKPVGASAAAKAQARAIRAWAAENGVACPAQGVVPVRVRQAYEAANGMESVS